MVRRVLLLLAALGCVTCLIDKTQIRALKRLLKGMDGNGVFATCNIAFFKELTNYFDADKNCKNFDIGTGRTEKGNLATIDNEDKNTELKLLLEFVYPIKDQPKGDWGDTKWVWSGLRKTKNNKETNAKKARVYHADDWEWADGSNPTEYHKWLRKQPDQNNQKYGRKFKGTNIKCEEEPRCFQNQMRINHKGQWDDTYKIKTHPYACDYQGKYILAAAKKTWVDAKKACADAGLHLAKIRNGGEVEEMKAAIEFFLGPQDSTWRLWDANNWIWTGGNDLEEEGVWKWLDGSPVEDWEIPWKPRAGNDNAAYLGAASQNALSFSRWGQFDDSFHDSKRRKRQFACQCPGS